MKSNFNHNVLKVFSKSEPDKLGNHMELRIVKWEAATNPVLEKRRVWTAKKTGEAKPRKLVGLDAEDIKLVLANAEEILQLLGEKR